MRLKKVAFTGTQGGMSPHQREKLRSYLSREKPQVLIHGGCIGADCEADAIAFELGIPREIYPSDIMKKQGVIYQAGAVYTHHPMNPLKRNRFMVDRAEMLIACPKSEKEVVRSGTWATIRYARKALPADKVWIISPDGE